LVYDTLRKSTAKSLFKMKSQALVLMAIGAATASPIAIMKREVPQEHSHRNIILQVNKALNINNPSGFGDPIFGLLGAKAAADGAGNLADPDCLQQAIADQAFTNAKAANDVDGMTAAMIYRALERNTGSVGLASVPCQSVKAVNPEIAALQQHQDPAGNGAQALNKQITTLLATQIAAIGGDATLANEASTFAPGQLNDSTAAGNTCDDDKDDAGCINSQNLRVDDLTAAEIQAAAGGAAAGGNANNGTNANNNAGNGNANAGNGNNKNKGNANAGNGNNANAGNGNNANAGNGNNANAGNGNNANAGNGNNANAGNGNNKGNNNNANNGNNNGDALLGSFPNPSDPDFPNPITA
jgi:hypothetical protein